jgi:hypothetical protein
MSVDFSDWRSVLHGFAESVGRLYIFGGLDDIGEELTFGHFY